MGTRNNAGECAAVKKLTFPSQVLPCSGSAGVISASRFFRKAPRGCKPVKFLNLQVFIAAKVIMIQIKNQCNLCIRKIVVEN
jgi:hypothetical protein